MKFFPQQSLPTHLPPALETTELRGKVKALEAQVVRLQGELADSQLNQRWLKSHADKALAQLNQIAKLTTIPFHND